MEITEGKTNADLITREVIDVNEVISRMRKKQLEQTGKQ